MVTNMTPMNLGESATDIRLNWSEFQLMWLHSVPTIPARSLISIQPMETKEQYKSMISNLLYIWNFLHYFSLRGYDIRKLHFIYKYTFKTKLISVNILKV